MENFNIVPDRGTFGGSVEVVNQNFLLAQQEMEVLQNKCENESARAIEAENSLRQLYNNLQQSQPVPVTQLPATGEAGKIYRLAGTTSYADYMYAEGALTTPIKMAEFDNAIDDEPTPGSGNIVRSDGLFRADFSNRILRGDHVDISTMPRVNRVISTSDGEYSENPSYSSMILDVHQLKGQMLRVESQEYTVMVRLTKIPEIGETVVDVSQKLSTSNVIYIDEDTNYLYVLTKRVNRDLAVSEIYSLAAYYEHLRESLLNNGNVEVEKLADCGFTINNKNTWSSVAGYYAKLIPVMDYRGGRCSITMRAGVSGYSYAFIKTLPKAVYESVIFSSSDYLVHRETQDSEIAIPVDARYMFVYNRSLDYITLPSAIKLKKQETTGFYQSPIRFRPTGSLDIYGERVGGGYQSMAMYGKYGIFVYQGGDVIQATIYNIKTFTRVCSVTLPYDRETLGECHCNTSVFSRTFYQGNTIFPLLYINQWGNDEDGCRQKRLFVYNVILNETDNTASAELVQVIEPTTALCNNSKFGTDSGDFVVDYDNNKLVHIGYCSYSDYTPTSVSTFNLPSCTDGDDIITANGIATKKVVISESDLLDYFGTINMRGFQDKHYIAGQVFVGYGFSKSERESLPSLPMLPPLSIGVIDLNTKSCKVIEIEEFNGLSEIEGVEVLDGKLLIDGLHADSGFNKYVYKVNI